jgi:hypothetical protein
MMHSLPRRRHSKVKKEFSKEKQKSQNIYFFNLHKKCAINITLKKVTEKFEYLKKKFPMKVCYKSNEIFMLLPFLFHSKRFKLHMDRFVRATSKKGSANGDP